MKHDMLIEIDEQRYLGDSIASIERDADSLIDSFREVDSVHMLGSGDSYFAAEAVLPLFQSAGEVQFHSHTAHQFSQYVAPRIGSGDMVVPISVSGNSIRTVEAADRARDSGATIVGVTNSKDGMLHKEFDDSLLMNLDTEPGWIPGTLTYTGLVGTLFYLGIRITERGGDRPAEIEMLHRTLESVGEAIDFCDPIAETVAANLSYTDPPEPIYLLGGGQSRATAQYGAAKFLELCDTLAIGQESEEFAHHEYWNIDKSNPVFVLAPEGAGFGRTQEVAAGIRRFGNDVVVVTDDNDFTDLGKYSFEIPVADNRFSPLLYQIPLQLTTYYYALKQGLDPNNGSHVDPHRKAVADEIHSGKRY